MGLSNAIWGVGVFGGIVAITASGVGIYHHQSPELKVESRDTKRIEVSRKEGLWDNRTRLSLDRINKRFTLDRGKVRIIDEKNDGTADKVIIGTTFLRSEVYERTEDIEQCSNYFERWDEEVQKGRRDFEKALKIHQRDSYFTRK